MRGRHVLVVEGHHRAAVDDGPQHVEVAVVADHVVGDHLRGGDALGLGEQPQRQGQGDGRLRHHPGELAAADHGQHGSARGRGGAVGHAGQASGCDRVTSRPRSGARPGGRSPRGRGCAGLVDVPVDAGLPLAWAGLPVSKRRPLPRIVVMSVGRRLSSPSLRRTQPRCTSMVFDEVQKVVSHTSSHQLVPGDDLSGLRHQRVEEVELLARERDLAVPAPHLAALRVQADVLDGVHGPKVGITHPPRRGFGRSFPCGLDQTCRRVERRSEAAYGRPVRPARSPARDAR